MKDSIMVFIVKGEVVIEADRDGLRRISEVAMRLASLSDSEAQTPANHFHFMEGMKNIDRGSLSLIITRKDA